MMKYSFLLLLFVLLRSYCLGQQENISVFLLGDSTSERLYVHGLLPQYNCTVIDPRINRNVEAVRGYGYNVNRGMLCDNDAGLVRVGYLIHWGVSRISGDYLSSFGAHRSPDDTDNSITNILNTVREFQQRTSSDHSQVFFVFLSSLWDIQRYNEKIHQKVLNSTTDQFLQNYHRDYTRVIVEILDLLRPRDKLIIQTQHEAPKIAALIKETNRRATAIAQLFDLPIYDTAAIASTEKKQFLSDGPHQMPFMSVRYAQALVKRIWSTSYISALVCA